jgi:hypothetical protein
MSALPKAIWVEDESVADAFLGSLARARHVSAPYDHWFLDAVLPEEDVSAVLALPFLPPQDAIFNGKRETNNAVRVYFNPESQARFAVCRRIAEGFLDPRVLRAIEEKTGADLSDSRLRIEYCQDTEGFWLAPHTDISVKTFSMLIYLSDDPRLINAGTDLHEGPPEFKHVASAPYGRNLGFIFVPSKNTWHAVGKRPLNGAIRKSLIVNYVTSAWRETSELS